MSTETSNVYIVYHKPAHVLNGSIFVPIQVGRSTSSTSLEMIGDDTGDNISNKNNSYCELTAMYWVWKNRTSSQPESTQNKNSFVGFMHYRRFLDFSNKEISYESKYGMLECNSFYHGFENEFGLTTSNINKLMRTYDIILPRKWSVKQIGFKTLYDHYCSSPDHHCEDLKKTGDIIKNNYPDFYSYYLSEIENNHEGYFTNVFIMRTDIFNNYCTWLFELLSDVEKAINIDGYNQSEQRVFGYLAERLINVYIAWLRHERENINILELARVFVEDTKPRLIEPKIPKSNNPVVSIVTVSDDNYVPHVAALIVSILQNSSNNYFYDIIILDGGITRTHKLDITRLTKNVENAHISFLDMSNEFLDSKTHMHFARATYYRLLLPEILKERKKIIYLDSDMIVLDDISTIFFEDFDGCSVLAVHDYIMSASCNTGLRSISTTGGLPARKYLTDYLSMGSRYNQYFQAGLLVYDLPALRAEVVSQKMIDDLNKNVYWFLDQDILNKHLKNVKYLPARWNLLNVSNIIYDDLSESEQADLLDAIENPAVVHYAGFEAKPWNNHNASMSGYYWQYLRHTPWYEEVYYSGDILHNTIIAKQSFPYRSLRYIWRRLPFKVRRLLSPIKQAVFKLQ